jgi:ATP-dependent Zn protease
MKSLHFLFCAVLLLTLSCDSLFGAEATYLTYNEFISEVDSGSVKSVTLDQFSQISGTYIVDGAERPFMSYGHTGSANDVLLARLLKQKAVAVTLKDQKERHSLLGADAFMGLAMFIVPLVTLVLAFRIHAKLSRLQNEPKA